MIPNKTVRMRVYERVPDKADAPFRLCVRDGKLALDPRYTSVPTRDAILSAEDPNDPSPRSAIGGICDPGKIWTGIEDALNSLPVEVRDAVGARFMNYAASAGWKNDSLRTGDGGRRLTNFDQRQRASTSTIAEMNEKNASFWSDETPRSTTTTDARAGDKRQTARDGAALAGATRDLVASINESNRRHWGSV